MSTPANFNGAKPIIDPANAAMLARGARLAAQVTYLRHKPARGERCMTGGEVR